MPGEWLMFAIIGALFFLTAAAAWCFLLPPLDAPTSAVREDTGTLTEVVGSVSDDAASDDSAAPDTTADDRSPNDSPTDVSATEDNGAGLGGSSTRGSSSSAHDYEPGDQATEND